VAPLVGKVKMLRERLDIGKALMPEQERALLQATAERDSACHTATVLALNTTLRSDKIKQLTPGNRLTLSSVPL
jgi:hypothetical protein